MSYPVNTPITYAAVASTPGLWSDTFTYSWAFDDGGTGNTASLSHTWTMVGSHAATVTATDLQTGGTGTTLKTVNIATPPSNLLNTVSGSKAFVDPNGNVWTALGSGDGYYQFNKLLANGATAKIYTQGYTDASGQGVINNGDVSAAISADGLWIVSAGYSGASAVYYLTAVNTSTGVVQKFDMTTIGPGGATQLTANQSVMIVARSDNKFAISVQHSAGGTGYTFIYNPATNTYSSWIDGSVGYLSGIVIKADDSYAYCFYGYTDVTKYNVVNHSWASPVAMSRTAYIDNTRMYPSIVKMADGRFMLVGGHDGGATAIKKTAIFDPTGSLSLTDKADLNTARYWPSIALLPDGKILAAGGRVSDSGAGLASAEIYDPVANTWTTLGVSMSQARGQAPIAQLPSGNFVIIGGINASGISTNTVEYFHPADNKFYSVD